MITRYFRRADVGRFLLCAALAYFVYGLVLAPPPPPPPPLQPPPQPPPRGRRGQEGRSGDRQRAFSKAKRPSFTYPALK